MLVHIYIYTHIHTHTYTDIISCGTSQSVEWLQDKRPKNRVSIPEGIKEFIRLQKRPEWHWVPPTFLLRGHMIVFPRGKCGGDGNMTTHLHLVSILRKISQLLHIRSQLLQG